MSQDIADRANQATSDYMDRKDAIYERDGVMGTLAQISGNKIVLSGLIVGGMFALGPLAYGAIPLAVGLLAVGGGAGLALNVAKRIYIDGVEQELDDQAHRDSIFESTLRDECAAAGTTARLNGDLPDLRGGFKRHANGIASLSSAPETPVAEAPPRKPGM